MSNAEVIAAFIEGRFGQSANLRSQPQGVNKEAEAILYSYAEPIAYVRRSPGVDVVVTTEKFSVTTSKQTTQTIAAAEREGRTVVRIDHADLRKVTG